MVRAEIRFFTARLNNSQEIATKAVQNTGHLFGLAWTNRWRYKPCDTIYRLNGFHGNFDDCYDNKSRFPDIYRILDYKEYISKTRKCVRTPENNSKSEIALFPCFWRRFCRDCAFDNHGGFQKWHPWSGPHGLSALGSATRASSQVNKITHHFLPRLKPLPGNCFGLHRFLN